MLGRIQAILSELYDLELGVSVEDFVCDETVARAAVGDAVARREVLVVVEEPEDVSVGLYVDPEIVRTLEGTWGSPGGTALEAFRLAAEGVSHFVYLMFRARNAQSVSELELELQAEVDTYAAALFVGRGRTALGRSRSLRRRLFTGTRFVDGAGTEPGERYRLAHRLASRYTERLERRYVERGHLGALASELRRFYRMGARQKLEAAGT